jgi:hypothetical protein
MAQEFYRIVTKTATTGGVVPTIPPTNDHQDGSWLDTDVYVGELFWNSSDALLYTRDDNDNVILINGAGDGKISGVITVEVDRTLLLTDANKLIRLDGTTDRVFTVPPNSSVAFDIGVQILVQRINTAELDIATGVGVTINSVDGNLSLDGQNAMAVLIKTNTNEWTLAGKLKA